MEAEEEEARELEDEDEYLLYEELKFIEFGDDPNLNCDSTVRMSKILEHDAELGHQDGDPFDRLQLANLIDSFSADPNFLVDGETKVEPADGHQQQQQQQQQLLPLVDLAEQTDNFSPASSGYSSASSALVGAVASEPTTEFNHSSGLLSSSSCLDTNQDVESCSFILTPDSRAAEQQEEQTQSVATNNNNFTSENQQAAATAGGRRLRAGNMNKQRRRTANARERIRMREINKAFERLKGVVPMELMSVIGAEFGVGDESDNSKQVDQNKLTKINTLRLAVSYISKLTDILNETSAELPTKQQIGANQLESQQTSASTTASSKATEQ